MKKPTTSATPMPLNPELKGLIDRVIVPALLERLREQLAAPRSIETSDFPKTEASV